MQTDLTPYLGKSPAAAKKSLLYFSTEPLVDRSFRGPKFEQLPGSEAYGERWCLGLWQFFRYLRPQNVPWDLFPVLSAPNAELYSERGASNHSHSPGCSSMVLDVHALKTLMATQEVFVYVEGRADTGGGMPEKLRQRNKVAQMYSLLTPGKDMFVCFTGSQDFIKVDPVEFGQISEGTKRAFYNYEINFAPILARGLDALIKIEDMTFYKHAINSDRGYDDNQLQHIGRKNIDHAVAMLEHPLALQALFAISKMNEDEQARLAHVYEEKKYISVGPFIQVGRWVGTGAYPSHDISMILFDALNAAYTVDLIERVKGSRVQLTQLGHRFLATIGKGLDRPDTLLEFTDPATECIPASRNGDIDLWIAEFFGQMKANVEALA